MHLTPRGANMSWGNNDVKVSSEQTPAKPPPKPPSCPPSAKSSTASANSIREPWFHSRVDNHSPNSPEGLFPPPRPASSKEAVAALPDVITSPRKDPSAAQSLEQQEAAPMNTIIAAASTEKTGVDHSSDGDGDGDDGGFVRRDSKNASMQTDTIAKPAKESGNTKEKKKKSFIGKGKLLSCFPFLLFFLNTNFAVVVAVTAVVVLKKQQQ